MVGLSGRGALQLVLQAQVAPRLPGGEAPDEPGAYFRTGELVDALADDPLVTAHARGELDAMLDEADWLGGLEPGAPLGERTWGHVGFLLGALHGYLERARDAAWARLAPGVDPPPAGQRARPAEAFDPAGRRALAGERSFEDLLGRWD